MCLCVADSENGTTELTFKWDDALIGVLKRAPGKQLAMKKLRKKVLYICICLVSYLLHYSSHFYVLELDIIKPSCYYITFDSSF